MKYNQQRSSSLSCILSSSLSTPAAGHSHALYDELEPPLIAEGFLMKGRWTPV